ncbi:hypothetical protein BJV78DRAFT_1253576 [Lactifluus subvellereus]|nr:hypothetical protein BJV78DRAFT_1253576 [Lactifluus subvellereus]
MMFGLSSEQLFGLAIFASYFLFILLLFFIIVESILERNRVSGSVSLTHIGLTLSSFGYTWYYMISFMWWSFVEYDRSSPGSSAASKLNTALFEQAWTIVCDEPLRWWWSEQLCLFTVGFWTVFLLTKGREHGVKHVWAYMLFGQLVAISVATNLFFLALPPPTKMKPRATATVPPILWLSVLASLVTVFLVPHSLRHDYFLPNLLAMHVLLVIPLLPVVGAARTGRRLHMRTRTLYLLVALLCGIARGRTTLLTRSIGGPRTLWAGSIGWDVMWTTITFIVWVRSSTSQVMLVLVSVLGSIGTSAPLYLYLK